MNQRVTQFKTVWLNLNAGQPTARRENVFFRLPGQNPSSTTTRPVSWVAFVAAGRVCVGYGEVANVLVSARDTFELLCTRFLRGNPALSAA